MKSKMLRTKSKGEKHLNESSVTIVNACRVSFFYMSSSSVMFLSYNIQKRKKKKRHVISEQTSATEEGMHITTKRFHTVLTLIACSGTPQGYLRAAGQCWK